MDQLVKWAGLTDHQNSCEKKFMELRDSWGSLSGHPKSMW